MTTTLAAVQSVTTTILAVLTPAAPSVMTIGVEIETTTPAEAETIHAEATITVDPMEITTAADQAETTTAADQAETTTAADQAETTIGLTEIIIPPETQGIIEAAVIEKEAALVKTITLPEAVTTRATPPPPRGPQTAMIRDLHHRQEVPLMTFQDLQPQRRPAEVPTTD
jgi:hypothetical protein